MDMDCILLGYGLSTRQRFRSRRRLVKMRDTRHEEEERSVTTTPHEAMECFLHRSRTLFAIHDNQKESGLKENTQPLLYKKSARYQVRGRAGNVHCIVIKRVMSLVALVGFTIVK